MIRYDDTRATDVRSAAASAAREGAKVIAGGTNLVDLLKHDVERLRHLVDITRLPGPCAIADTEAGVLRTARSTTTSPSAPTSPTSSSSTSTNP